MANKYANSIICFLEEIDLEDIPNILFSVLPDQRDCEYERFNKTLERLWLVPVLLWLIVIKFLFKILLPFKFNMVHYRHSKNSKS